MNYFIVKDSLEETLVGRDYPQAYDFIKGYNEEAPDSLFSLYDYWDSFPNYIPNLDGVKLAGCAKLTDFVSDGFCSRMQIVGPKAKLTLEQFNLCAHKFYPLGLYKRKIKYEYFLFFDGESCAKYVDYKKTSFRTLNYADDSYSEEFYIQSEKEYWEKRNKLEQDGIFGNINGKKIVMSHDFPKYDFFTIGFLDGNTYVSERLKETIEHAGLTGWVFNPATHLIVED